MIDGEAHRGREDRSILGRWLEKAARVDAYAGFLIEFPRKVGCQRQTALGWQLVVVFLCYVPDAEGASNLGEEIALDSEVCGVRCGIEGLVGRTTAFSRRVYVLGEEI